MSFSGGHLQRCLSRRVDVFRNVLERIQKFLPADKPFLDRIFSYRGQSFIVEMRTRQIEDRSKRRGDR